MKRIITVFLLLLAMMPTALMPTSLAEEPTSRILIAYVSRAGENYNVGVTDPNSASASYAGYIEKGNTEIMAEHIAELTGGDLYPITTVDPYPEDYQSMLTRAREELDSNARPELAGDLPDLSKYDIIFIGYPIWHASTPRPVLSFLESYDLTGKTVIPFNTHEGSGQSNTVQDIETSSPNAVLRQGLAIQGKIAQEDEAATMEMLNKWRGDLDLLKETNNTRSAEATGTKTFTLDAVAAPK